MERQLTKREYLGEGYVHVFMNDKTGDIVNIPCTEQEYHRLGEAEGTQFNPTLEGHTWLNSQGGTLKVDTPDTTLGENEYCDIGTESIVLFAGVKLENKYQTFSKEKISADKINESFVVGFVDAVAEEVIP